MKAQLLGHTQHPLSHHGAARGQGPSALSYWESLCPQQGLWQWDVPYALLGPKHFTAPGPWGEQDTRLSLGQGSLCRCPAGMLLPGHKEIFCSCSIKAICVSLPAGRDPAQGRKSSGYSRGSSTEWGQCGDGGVLSSRGAMGCPLPLLAPALPSPNAREATYQNSLAGPQMPAQSPTPVLSASPSKRNSFHRRSRRRPQECVSSPAS